MSEKAISLNNISKKYLLGSNTSGNLKETISGIFNNGKREQTEFWALKDVSFEVNQGDAIGIIGKNGAGKSTLLKVLSRITEPTYGRIEINGRISSLLEVGTGFHPDLTGRENVFLNGTILGMSRAEVKSKFDEIVDFSGIEKFLDTPVKRYSSGMKVRLGFAVAAHLEPEILVIDEVLAVGDAEFQKKCLGKMNDVRGSGRTILFVSHNMGAVKRLCNKGIVLKNGCVGLEGNITQSIDYYLKENESEEQTQQATRDFDDFTINEISIYQKEKSNIITSLADITEDIFVEIQYDIKKDITPFRVKLRILQQEEIVFQIDDTISNTSLESRSKGNYVCTFQIPKNLLNAMHYNILLGVDMPKRRVLMDFTEIVNLKIEDTTGIFKYTNPGFVRPLISVKTIKQH